MPLQEGEMNDKYHAIKVVLQVGMETFPHLRLGQIILNAVPKDKLYYMTDTELVKALWAYINERIQSEEE